MGDTGQEQGGGLLSRHTENPPWDLLVGTRHQPLNGSALALMGTRVRRGGLAALQIHPPPPPAGSPAVPCPCHLPQTLPNSLDPGPSCLPSVTLTHQHQGLSLCPLYPPLPAPASSPIGH